MSDVLTPSRSARPSPQTSTRPAEAAAARSGRVEVVSFGCRLNALEGDHARAAAENPAGERDTIIVNTCAVTSEAVRQARQTVRRLRREQPEARLVVTGCAAQIAPESFAAMGEVDAVLGNQEKLSPTAWSTLEAPDAPRILVNDIMSVRETAGHLLDAASQTGSRARAFVQVQNGCDHRCTFCIIPYGRGNARSVPAGVVVETVQRLVDAGHQEVVLTGVDITSWGQDLPGQPPLGALIRRILRGAPELYRLRFSSLDAVEIDPELFEFVAHEPRIAPHLHLSLQAGDDMILKRMKRRHSRADAIALCARVREARPEVAFGADLIAGFPTETEAMFENSLALIEDCDLSFVHVFPFSPREGTPAARMPQVERAVIKARAARLREAASAALARRLDRHVGQDVEALVEKTGRDGLQRGRLGDFCEIRLDAGAARPGAVVRARVTGHDGRTLLGIAAS